MKILGWTLVTAPWVATAAFASYQQTPVLPATARARIAIQAEDRDGPRAWRERLENQDLDARERDFEALVERASESDDFRASLRSWAEDRTRAEFAWTCRLALREVKSRPDSRAGGRSTADPFEELRRRMFSGDLGSDPFGGFFRVDPFGGNFSGSFGQFDPFQGLPQGSDLQSQSGSFSLEIGPDGVKARVRKNVDGVQREDEFTAASVEELLRAHPEFSEQVRGSGSGSGGGFGLRFGLPGFDFERGGAGALRTDVLGVYIATEPSNAAAGATGLCIERVQPGSLAEKLGLEPGQVLTTLNGRALHSRDDIREVLRERRAEDAVEVEVQGVDGARSTKTWKPSKDARGEARPLQPRPLQDTRKI